jgi:hypothetical protein
MLFDYLSNVRVASENDDVAVGHGLPRTFFCRGPLLSIARRRTLEPRLLRQHDPAKSEQHCSHHRKYD